MRGECRNQGAKGNFLGILLLLLACTVSKESNAEAIASAQYEAPVERYGHFALGRPHEYARLRVTTDTGRSLVFDLPKDEVFEDLKPRLIRLAAHTPNEILAIVSQRNSGARLVLIGLRAGQLEMSAQSAAIGTPQRWLNPVGVADLDGDGRAEIAAVITPHIGGTLKIYRQQARQLVEVAALGGFSNHIYGSPELELSITLLRGTRTHLLVPDFSRLHLRLIALEDGRLTEAGRCTLPAPVTGAIIAINDETVSVGLASGRQTVNIKHCTTK